MILFLDDWKKYPTARPHLETTNTSYIELASLYRDMGVKNHFFHLALVDQDLKYVDPHSTDITPELALKIIRECTINPWYYFREVARAPARGTSQPPKLRANRANISLWWSFFNHIQYFLIQPRQTGKSLSTDVLMIYLMQIRCRNTKFSLLTKDDALRTQNVQRIKDLMDDLPRYIDQRRRTDANNGEKITVDALGNEYLTFVPQASEKRALNLGRGVTTGVFHTDEPPFCVNIAVSLPAALASMGAAVEAAKENNAPYGTIFTTTAGKKDDKDGRYIYNMLQKGATWDEAFFDALNEQDLNERIYKAACKNTDPSQARIRINGTFSHRQLGFDDDWLIERLRESESEGDDGKRDFLNVWTSGTESSPFPPDVTERIALSKCEPNKQEVTELGCRLKWYVPEEEIPNVLARKLVAGMDLSEAIKNDSIAMTIVDPTNLRTIATMNLDEVNTFTFCKWLADFMTENPNIIFVPERKSIGQTIVDYLMRELPLRGINPFKRIFNMVYHEYEEKVERYQQVRANSSRLDDALHDNRSAFGYTTTGSGKTSRDMLYNATLNKAIKHASAYIKDETLATQMLQLIIKNGRIDHDAHGHDDQVVSWLLACWFILFGKGHHLYDIPRGYVLAEVGKKEATEPADILYQQQQRDLRNQIDAIYKEFDKEDNDWIFAKLEQQLRTLSYKLDNRESNEVHSMDELINQAKEKRKKRKQERKQTVRTTVSRDYNPWQNYRRY